MRPSFHAELSEVEGPAVHEPWKLADHLRERLDYPEPVVAP